MPRVEERGWMFGLRERQKSEPTGSEDIRYADSVAASEKQVLQV